MTLINIFTGLYPALFTGRTLNKVYIIIAPNKFIINLLHMVQVILPFGFCVVFFKDLDEKTEVVTARCDIASRSISFASIKLIVSLKFFSLDFPILANFSGNPHLLDQSS